MQDNFGSGSTRVGSGSDWESSRFLITVRDTVPYHTKKILMLVDRSV